VGASSITSETFGKVAHLPPRASRETDRKNKKKGFRIVIVYSNGKVYIDQHERHISKARIPAIPENNYMLILSDGLGHRPMSEM
jgi:hypothetical protein